MVPTFVDASANGHLLYDYIAERSGLMIAPLPAKFILTTSASSDSKFFKFESDR